MLHLNPKEVEARVGHRTVNIGIGCCDRTTDHATACGELLVHGFAGILDERL